MNRANYTDEIDQKELAMWRGAVARAIRGKRGQSFLREMLAAMDALPHPVLIADQLEEGGEVCAIGSVGARRGISMADMDPEDADALASTFGISQALVREISYINDEYGETPEQRFKRVREWVVKQIV